MLKQGIKAINAEFVWARALPKLSFAQFRPYATSFPGLLLSMVLMSKSKRPLETFGPYVFIQDLRWRKGQGSCFECGLFVNFVVVILFKRNMAEKMSAMHTCLVLWTIIFLFVQTFYFVDDFLRLKKE